MVVHPDQLFLCYFTVEEAKHVCDALQEQLLTTKGLCQLNDETKAWYADHAKYVDHIIKKITKDARLGDPSKE